jgi:hypothetical protein
MKVDKLAKYDKKEDVYSFPNFIALSYIKDTLENSSKDLLLWKEKYYEDDKNCLDSDKNTWEQFLQIFDFEFKKLLENEITDKESGKLKKIGYNIYKQDLSDLFSKFHKDKVLIKNYADTVLWIYQMAKYFAVEKKRAWMSDYELDVFYTEPDLGYLTFYGGAYEEIVQVYNKIRNYLTKKPYSENKWKLNFENSTLADGWDKNKESDNSTVILRKNNRYYLALMKKGNNKIFDDKNQAKFLDIGENKKYQKIVYKLLPGANKMLPKVFFSKKNIKFYDPSDEILKIRNHSSHSKNGVAQKGFNKLEFNINDCHKIIDFFKESLVKHSEWNLFNFSFSETSFYKDTGSFYKEVENGGYKISFQDISEKYINEKNENGELYLFKINNKDWNEGSIGKKNLQTLYFESLFSEENIVNNFPMKLNGQAEIFYRPKTKGLEKNKIITEKNKIELKKGNRAFTKNRFTENKIFFHVPITLNRTAGDIFKFNVELNNFLANNKDINIIGIDRGEKHLAYYSIIDQNVSILKQGSLNIVNNIDYQKKLEEIAKGREQSRKDWGLVEGIKNLKKGYISHVVHVITDLAIEYNAIIVLEDLNMRFKQIRGGIEKSIYQQLEKALIDKLSFLVQKGGEDTKKAVNLFKAYQLTAPFVSFQKMGKQTGVLFYTQASYTSKTCPSCGFRPNIHFKYNTIEKAQDFWKKIDGFTYDQNKNIFKLSYSLTKIFEGNVQNKKERDNILFADSVKKDKFVISSESALRHKWKNKHINEKNLKNGESIYSGTDTGTVLTYDITKSLIGLFERHNIDYTNKNIIEQISDKKLDSTFYKDLFYYLSMLLNTRDSISGDEGENADKIVCPCCHFDSKNGFQDKPFNGDANGAYNIARKGFMLLDKISQYYNTHEKSCDRLSYAGLYIDNEEWDKFTQK